MTHSSIAGTPVPLQQDIRTIGLIGLAHGTSHFFHMLLPPLFPWFISDFGLSYSELGALVSVFFIVSGVGQALAGFVVDRVGARPVLYLALLCFALAALAMALAQGWGGLALAAALAGLGGLLPQAARVASRRHARARVNTGRRMCRARSFIGAGSMGGSRMLTLTPWLETRTPPTTGFWPGTWRCLPRAGSRPPSPAWMRC